MSNYDENFNDYEPDYDDYGYDAQDEIDWEEEKWYALTDGMYGDYPGPGVDYDAFGF